VEVPTTDLNNLEFQQKREGYNTPTLTKKGKVSMRHSNRIALALFVMAASFVPAACGIAGTAQIPQVTIKTHDYSFEAPAQIEAGLVSITMENEGQEPHHVQLVRLNDGVTTEQFQAALQQSPEAAMPLVSFAGGPGVVPPGQSQQVDVELNPGHYFLLCLVPSSDGIPHLAKGMLAPLEVVAPTAQASASEPKADSAVRLLDFSFVLPSEINAGRHVWKVTNEGKQPHELALIKLADGKTMQDVATFMQSPSGPPPWVDAGGLQAIDPGESGWVNLDLQPGNYVALCHVPDPASGKAHEEMGMVMPFTVN
jgi:uncharacterized cupredoxin-like copper-binding protein